MIEAFDGVEPGPDGEVSLEADVCIVGSGPAGISLALALEGSGLRCLLLESGLLEYDEAHQALNRAQQDGPLPPMLPHQSRLRMLGGTSNHWGGACGKLDEIDFEARAWMPLSGWPFGLESLEPHYAAAAELLGLGDGDFDAARFRTDEAPLLALAESELEHRVRIRRDVRFGREFRERLEASSSTRIVFGATAVGLEFGDEMRSVRSLRVRSLGGRSGRVVAPRIVLACGGIENARFLLATGLGARLDFIGRCFTWHPRLVTSLLLLEQAMPLEGHAYDWHPAAGRDVSYVIAASRAALRYEEMPNHALFAFPVVTDTANAVHGLKQRFAGEEELEGFIDDFGTVLDDLQGSAAALRDHAVMIGQTWLDQEPNPESRISLSDERDALGVPRARVAWRLFDHERASVLEFNQWVARQLGAAGVAHMRVDREFLRPAGFLEAVVHGDGGGHQIGTTRMSEGPSNGVVDANGRVHGVANLYCAGSSVFPTGGWMNPTFTIVALSLRLAGHLRRELAGQ